MHPPASTALFPYTTLFRSTSRGAGQGHGGRGLELDIALLQHGLGHDAEALATLEQTADAGSADISELLYSPLWENLDRKSTRLNSSHITTSYAVFCLKKKT